MGKGLELSQATYERLLALAQQRACTPEELLHTLLVDAEQAQYYHANQQMLAQGMLASMPRAPGSTEFCQTNRPARRPQPAPVLCKEGYHTVTAHARPSLAIPCRCAGFLVWFSYGNDTV